MLDFTPVPQEWLHLQGVPVDPKSNSASLEPELCCKLLEEDVGVTFLAWVAEGCEGSSRRAADTVRSLVHAGHGTCV